jgi:hypothetical protein
VGVGVKGEKGQEGASECMKEGVRKRERERVRAERESQSVRASSVSRPGTFLTPTLTKNEP